MRCFFVILYFCFFLHATSSQVGYGPQNQYKFKYLTIDQGLSNNSIRTICQDSKGVIWFGTQNGLNKYDGHGITNYWSFPEDSTTLTSNIINEVFLDSDGVLWIANGDGIDRYNLEYDNFTRFTHKEITWPIWQVFTVTEDNNGLIWFGGSSGLYSYNKATKEIQQFSSQIHDPNGVFPGAIYKILVDKDNRIWCSVTNSGLYVLNQDNKTFEIYQNDPNDPTSIQGIRFESLYMDHAGNIWAGSLNTGLNRFIPETNSFKHYPPDEDNKYSSRVRTFFEDLKGDLFIGTRAGLYIYNKENDEFVLYASEDHNFSKLSQNSIRSSLVDKNGILWIGTFSGGVNYTNLNKKEFTHYIAGKNDNQYLSGSNIYSFIEDPKGNLWVGGDLGLNYFDRETSTFSYFMNDPDNPNSISYNDVKDLEWDEKGNLWIATNRGGLNYYNVKTKKFTQLRHNPNDSSTISGDKVYCIHRDGNNNLWIISTPNNDLRNLGLDILPHGQKKVVRLKEAPYFSVDEDKNGNIYIGSRQGIWKFEPTDSVFSFIANDAIGSVNTIKVDSKSKIWIGCTTGLTRYDPETKTFFRLTKSKGYAVDEVVGILEDERKNLWVSTISGLIKLEGIVTDTANIKLQVFDQYDGLQSKQFNFNAYYKCRSGEMVFGGVNGFSTFFPDSIVENKTPATVNLTHLRIYNKIVPIGEEVRGRVILEKSMAVTNEITLGPEHKIFSVEYASLQNINPEKFAYRTKLTGLDTEWQYRTLGNNIVTYTNLKPGEYTFLVSASNNDGYWNDQPTSLKIIILPAVWETWWFRILAFVAISLLIFLFYYYRSRAIRKQNLVLEKTVKSRTKEVTNKNRMLQEANMLLHEKQEKILAQNEELERNRNSLKDLVNELEQHRSNLTELVKERTLKLEHALEKAKESDALKSAFLANMSHEIRTPMNAVMGFTSLLSEEDMTPEEQEEYVGIIHANASSLIKIIDEILDLSLIESNQLKIKQEVFDFNVFLEQVFSFYRLNNTSESVEIKLNNTLADQKIKLNSDSVRIQQVITNLMDNAIKFTSSGEIVLGVYMEDGDLHIYVRDTGKGIPSGSIDTIFNHFTKVESEEDKFTRGLGLGLAISHSIAHAIGGTLTVQSEPGIGSQFTLALPDKILAEEVKTFEKVVSKTEPLSWKGRTIMIAEDTDANYLYLKRLLRKSQAEIIWARNGRQAIDLFEKEETIDLILMDIKMPYVDGYEAAQKIKLIDPNQKIVAQTAYARSEEKQRYYDKNFDDYISKPIKHDDLMDILNRFY